MKLTKKGRAVYAEVGMWLERDGSIHLTIKGDPSEHVAVKADPTKRKAIPRYIARLA
jgi:hypothetical protein